MRKFVFVFVLVALVATSMFFSSCTPARWYLVNSEGILTYNRQTGQLELMWSHYSKGQKADTSYVPVDSVITKK